MCQLGGLLQMSRQQRQLIIGSITAHNTHRKHKASNPHFISTTQLALHYHHQHHDIEPIMNTRDIYHHPMAFGPLSLRSCSLNPICILQQLAFKRIFKAHLFNLPVKSCTSFTLIHFIMIMVTIIIIANQTSLAKRFVFSQ